MAEMNLTIPMDQFADQVAAKVLAVLQDHVQAADPIEIIDTAELCRRLAINEQTALTYRKKGKIPFLLMGTVIRYNWHAVLKALETPKPKIGRK